MTDPSKYDQLFSRQQKLNQHLQDSGLDAIALNPSANLYYFLGLKFHLLERPIIAIFSVDNAPILVLPEFEAGKTRGIRFPLQVFTYSEDPSTWRSVFKQACEYCGFTSHIRLGLDPLAFRYLELNLLESALNKVSFTDASSLINSLRIIKDETEIQHIHQAVIVAQNALTQTLPLIHVGMTERELAAELTMQIFHCSPGSELAFAPIIAAGVNSANPHATPSDHKIAPGELLLIDWGAKIDDYLSDLTRTFAVCELPQEFKTIAQIVQDANQVGREIAKPGLPAHDIDFACRSFIEKAGFGQNFFHRTGHGFGMDEHEEPYIRNGNQKILEAGMTFTIEPGIYLANKGGVRIEDDIMITSQEAISLSDMERSVMVVG